MSRIFTLTLIFLLGGMATAADRPAPVAPRLVTHKSTGTLADISAELAKQTDLAFDLSGVDGTAKVNANFNNTPLWTAVESVADQANCFVSVVGNKVKLSKRPNGVGAVPSSVDGPFRVVLKRVVCIRNLERADTECEVHVEVQWEPRFPVYLIDGDPAANATAGKQKIATDAPTGRAMPTGYTHSATIRLKNVPRDAKQLDEITGNFRLVAAAKMLAVEFKDLTGDKPQTQTVEGVSVTLNPVKKFEKRAEFGVELEYPDTHPEFESFQMWSGGNVFRLYPPTDRTGRLPADYSASESGRRVRADYNFTASNGGAFTLPDLKGWRVVYETPCPMSEQTLRFTLKGVALP